MGGRSAFASASATRLELGDIRVSKRLLVAACAVAALTGVAMAQTSPPATSSPQTNQPAQSQPGGMRTVETTTAKVTFYAVQPTDMPLSNLYDLDVYNQQNEDIGEIEDVIVDDGKRIKAIVLSVGGFLGIGERYVAVDPSSIVITRQGDNMRAVVNSTREELRNAPEFKFEGNMRRTDD